MNQQKHKSNGTMSVRGLKKSYWSCFAVRFGPIQFTVNSTGSAQWNFPLKPQ